MWCEAPDVRGNLGEQTLDILLTEIADTVIPVLQFGSIDLNDGILSVVSSEVVDVTPADSSSVDMSKIRLANPGGTRRNTSRWKYCCTSSISMYSQDGWYKRRLCQWE